jgi:hypothetical protein
LQYVHPLTAPVAQRKTPQGYQTAVTGGDPSFFTSNCFTGVKTDNFSGTDQFGYPISATYTGNTYNGNENVAGCGYTPS